MTLGRYATRPVCVCDLLGARFGRWNDFVNRCLHAFKSHQPSFSYQRSLLSSRNLHDHFFKHNKIDLYLYCTCRSLSIHSHVFAEHGEPWTKLRMNHRSFLSCQHCRFAFEHQVSSLYGICTWNGTPKSSILIRFSIINHPFWGTIIFGNTHITDPCLCQVHGKLGWT